MSTQSEKSSTQIAPDSSPFDSKEIEQGIPIQSSTPPAIEPPPDGGTLAWMQVAGSFFLFMNSWGIVNTFGVYQTFYETNLLSHEAPSNISWIGSIQAFLLLIIGIATGPLFDLGYFYVLLSAGSFMVVFGMMMTSLCHEYWQVMLAQGLLVGLGSGFLFVPSVAIVSTYFTSKKSLATGIAASGSSIGGVIYPIIFARLQPVIGFGWATRVIGFIALATLLLCICIMRVRIQPKSVRRMLEPRAFKELPYSMFSFAEFFGFMGLYIPFFYIQSYATVQGVDSNLAFYLVSILNAASVFGRIIPNFIADKTGPLNILVPCCLFSAILAFAWIAIKDVAGIVVFCVLYGFFSGSFVSLPPTTIVSLSPDLSVVGARMGMSFSFAGLGILVGNPVAGAILDRHGWIGVQAFCGASVALACIFCFIARVSKTAVLAEKA
ncbi:major facilitator superfamily domain-containing protein [Trichoderma ceciliae]